MSYNIKDLKTPSYGYNRVNFTKKLKTIGWITLGWTVVSLLQFTNAYTVLEQVNINADQVNSYLYFQGSILTGILAGILGGGAIVFLWERWLRSKKYGAALVHIFLSYTLVYFLVALPSVLFYESKSMQLSWLEPEVWKSVLAQIFYLGSIHNYIFWLVIVVGTTIFLQVNDKYGPGVLKDFLLGKYFTPKREERIFMFLDLRSSTTIAEKLGEEKYFNFLNDVFKYATASILYTKGEIYQYVGDEIVISWKMDNGLENVNCIKCFTEVQKALSLKRDYFIQQYDVIPEFKAGLHYGHVMAGEIGVVKRDIVFSGDVLNTTARIQCKCNDLGVNILISKYLIDKLPQAIQAFTPRKMGDLLLKGKNERVVLFTV